MAVDERQHSESEERVEQRQEQVDAVCAQRRGEGVGCDGGQSALCGWHMAGRNRAWRHLMSRDVLLLQNQATSEQSGRSRLDVRTVRADGRGLADESDASKRTWMAVYQSDPLMIRTGE